VEIVIMFWGFQSLVKIRVFSVLINFILFFCRMEKLLQFCVRNEKSENNETYEAPSQWKGLLTLYCKISQAFPLGRAFFLNNS